MAIITGSRGRVELPITAIALSGTPDTAISHIFRWTGNITRDIFDISAFDDVDGDLNPIDARTKMGGLYHLTGNCEAWLDGAAPIDLDVAEGITEEDAVVVADFVLYTLDNLADAGVADRAGDTAGHRRLRFSGIITSIALDVDKTGPARVVIGFESGSEIEIDTWTP